jgi:hypothetical protein
LFNDSENDSNIQDHRLEHLGRLAKDEWYINVPRFMVCEVLSQCGRKKNKAPGADGIGWGALGCLPRRCVEVLAKRIEDRINNKTGHGKIIQDWCDIAVHLIPRLGQPSLPISGAP